MNGFKKILASVGVTALLAGGALAMSSSTANAAGCSAFAYKPNKSGETAQGTAGRTGCPAGEYVSLTTYLYHYQPAWADILRASTYSPTVANTSVTNRWTRPNTNTANGWDWYSKATTNSGQSAQSTLVRLW